MSDNFGKLMICTDLDRTLIPNGPEPETIYARRLFSQLVKKPKTVLVFVTGRHKELILDAIHNYDLPQPDFVISDVGSSIYKINHSDWKKLENWDEHIGKDWDGYSHESLHATLSDIKQIRLQECSKQNTYKLSYYVPLNIKTQQILAQISQRFSSNEIQVNLIWSIDEPSNIGLLDILPKRASKKHAIEFLMQQVGFSLQEVFFSGDSGNDISVMSSEVKSVLVANASDEVKKSAIEEANKHGQSDSLYIAKGNYLGMNGNYCAGILEGIAHYKPQIADWLTETYEKKT